MMKTRIAILVIVLFLAASCNWITLRSDDTLLAKAYGSRLYLEDIRGIIPAGGEAADSITFVKRYVDRWLTGQVVLHHAMQSVDVDEISLEQRVADYKNALITHTYETMIIKQEMDTVVTEEQLFSYYEQNQILFRLTEPIIHATYIKLPVASREANRIRRMYRSDDPEVLVELEEIALQHAATYYIGPDTWFLFGDILKDMPLQVSNIPNFLRNNRFSEITDDYFRYFLYIHEYKLKGDISPMAFEREKIKSFVLNQRKKEFIEYWRRHLFNQAIEANRVETFI